MISVKNTYWKNGTLHALYDLAQYEFGQQIIANAPAGIVFNPQITQENAYAVYFDNNNTITLCKQLYENPNYYNIIETLAHEMVHAPPQKKNKQKFRKNKQFFFFK